MATVDRIEKNYMGVTLYVTTRSGKNYACRADTWTALPNGRLRVNVRTWPGYGSYRGTVTLSRMEKGTFLEAFELVV